MLAPTIHHRSDPEHHLESIDVHGPFTTSDHVAALATVGSTLAAGAAGSALVVNLTAVSAISEVGVDGLRSLARQCAADGRQLIFVCADEMMRSELVLADLDTLAPVVAADEQAAAIAA